MIHGVQRATNCLFSLTLKAVNNHRLNNLTLFQILMWLTHLSGRSHHQSKRLKKEAIWRASKNTTSHKKTVWLRIYLATWSNSLTVLENVMKQNSWNLGSHASKPQKHPQLKPNSSVDLVGTPHQSNKCHRLNNHSSLITHHHHLYKCTTMIADCKSKMRFFKNSWNHITLNKVRWLYKWKNSN